MCWPVSWFARLVQMFDCWFSFLDLPVYFVHFVSCFDVQCFCIFLSYSQFRLSGVIMCVIIALVFSVLYPLFPLASNCPCRGKMCCFPEESQRQQSCATSTLIVIPRQPPPHHLCSSTQSHSSLHLPLLTEQTTKTTLDLEYFPVLPPGYGTVSSSEREREREREMFKGGFLGDLQLDLIKQIQLCFRDSQWQTAHFVFLINAVLFLYPFAD